MAVIVTDASQDQTFDYWTSNLADSCVSLDPPMPLCDGQGNVTAVVVKRGAVCRNGSTVTLYRLIGGRHIWYGGLLNVPGQTPFNPALDAATGTTINDVIWNFFAAHPKL